MTTPETDRLELLLRRDKRLRQWQAFLVTAFCGAGVVLEAVQFVRVRRFGVPAPDAASEAFGVPALAILIGYACLMATVILRVMNARKITTAKDPRAFTVVLNAFYAAGGQCLARNEPSLLIPHLESVGSPDGASLTPAQVAKLREVIVWCIRVGRKRALWCDGFVRATVECLCRIGDTQGLDAIRKIAKSGITQQTREAAIKAADELEQLKRAGGSLLRASREPDSAAELARAVVAPAPEDQLLRAAETRGGSE